jgi:pyruvate dehydrogenase E2 component (dihydrolipoamide acetyltransferase)
MASIDLIVPDIGDFKEVEIIELLVKPGDAISAEQSLITVESDKASMEIPASSAGILKSLSVKIGDKVSKGSLLGVVDSATAATAPAAAPPVAVAASATAVAPAPVVALAAVAVAPKEASELPAVSSGKAHASPSVRKYARELGVDVALVPATGLKGRVTAQDVQAYVKQAVAGGNSSGADTSGSSGAGLGLIAWPKVDFTKFGEIESQALSRIKKISGANLHRNWVMIPHVTNHDDADITDLEAFRVQLNKEMEKEGVKLTMLAFLIKACVHALKQFPNFNASLDGDQLVLKKYFHIGFAADTPNGLMVPVIRDADKKGVLEIARETSELAKKARDGKLAPAEMQGGCFSISSLGGIGGTYFTPIINAPEVAILGVCRSTTRPVWNGTAFAPRLILPLSLSWDHRVIDGASAARFNTYLATVLADFRRVLL